MRSRLQRVLHARAVGGAVGLDALGVDGRPLAEVERAALQGHFIRRAAHLAAQRVDLEDKVSLARAADGRIAGHVAHRVQIDREQHGVKAEARAGQRGLDARVSRADDPDVRCILHGNTPRK